MAFDGMKKIMRLKTFEIGNDRSFVIFGTLYINWDALTSVTKFVLQAEVQRCQV